MNYIVIDQGTSSTKGFLINFDGQILHSNKINYKLDNPKPFHFECDPMSILKDIELLFNEMIQVSGTEKIISTGFSFQRSTFLFWNKLTCKPLTPAISWQDSRATEVIKPLFEYNAKFWNLTGAPLSAHFGGPKFMYMLKNNKLLRQKIRDNEIYFGPLSSFITHAATKEPAIDESIICRTLMYNLEKGKWSDFATNLFNTPKQCLPPIKPVKHNYGLLFDSMIPLNVVIGDQQAALIGQNQLINHSIGSNFGTSASIQFNTGNRPVYVPGLISSILFSENKKKTFMVEGTINGCNSLFYHLENVLSIPHNKMAWHERVKNIKTNGIFIPGFNGLSAPYWKTGFNDIYVDLKNNKDQIIRAGMESIGFLIYDILEKLREAGLKVPEVLKASGGSARPVLLQFISDLTKLKIGYYDVLDQTAIGVSKILRDSLFKKDDYKLEVFSPNQLANRSIKLSKWKKIIIEKKIAD